MQNIVLIYKSGGRYNFADVLLLADQLTDKYKVYCYTDISIWNNGVLGGVTFRQLPNPSWKGWWAKMNLFSPTLLSSFPGGFLFLDLDTVINTEIEAVFPKFPELFYCLNDFYRPGNLASGIMWINGYSRKVQKIWSVWQERPTYYMSKFRGDQEFIASVTHCDMFFPEDVVTTFKPAGEWRMERPTTPIVCFHGRPSIWEAAEKVEWIKNYVDGSK